MKALLRWFRWNNDLGTVDRIVDELSSIAERLQDAAHALGARAAAKLADADLLQQEAKALSSEAVRARRIEARINGLID